MILYYIIFFKFERREVNFFAYIVFSILVVSAAFYFKVKVFIPQHFNQVIV